MPEEYRERARRLAAMLRARPDRHDQSVYLREEGDNECGTAACIAGWSVLVEGGAITIDAEGVMTWEEERRNADGQLTVGYVPSFDQAGMRYLGLGEDVAFALFDGDQREGDAVTFLEAIAAGIVDPQATRSHGVESTSEFRYRLMAPTTA